MARRTGPDAKTVTIVRERDGWLCVRCGRANDLQTHHRYPRRMGGSRKPWINQPYNLVTVCGESHRWIESRREEAMDLGLLLRDGDDPAEVPVHVRTVHRNRIVYLTPDGQMADLPLLEETP